MSFVACPNCGEESPIIDAKLNCYRCGLRASVIQQSKPQGCDLCGKVAELRPYGPKGEWVCFECGMKDEAACKRGFERRHGS